MTLSYALVTPARNEAENIERLAACLGVQTLLPDAWIIVDDSSTDGTPELARALERKHHWIRAGSSRRPSGDDGLDRGRRIGRDVVAFETGLALLDDTPDIAVKLDADVSIASNYFDRLLREFAADGSLGIASGSCYELDRGSWREQPVTGGHVRGASRAYRWACLQDVLPLEERIGWDGIDELKAGLCGWTTKTIQGLPFYHHRRVGQRDGRRRGWAVQGAAAHFMGYRFSYLLFRAVHRARRDPAALAMVTAYIGAVRRGEPRCADAAVRASLRDQQRLRRLPVRAREAVGRRP